MECLNLIKAEKESNSAPKHMLISPRNLGETAAFERCVQAHMDRRHRLKRSLLNFSISFIFRHCIVYWGGLEVIKTTFTTYVLFLSSVEELTSRESHNCCFEGCIFDPTEYGKIKMSPFLSGGLIPLLNTRGHSCAQVWG